VDATLSVLFTDAVASTATLAQLGDERFGVVQDEHLRLLRAAVVGHRGREVKSLGDGLLVAFTGAADALGCAVAMQQAVEASQRGGADGLGLRVGVACGDVTVDDGGDVHGSVVVEAARLCASATAGQILASEVARRLVGSRGGHAYTPMGRLELRGFADPVAVVEVGWAPLSVDHGLAPVPLPPRLAHESSWFFVGRADELQRLSEAWEAVVAGAHRVLLLGGEPGVGKTRLARELAVRAHREGALVLFGRIDENLAVAYQPFAEALAHYLAAVDSEARDRTLSLRGGVLARLVPGMVERQPEGQVEEWAMFEGLADWLEREAQSRPVVLVVDDVHWAASATLGALMHLARSDRLGRVLIVGTYRDTELGRMHPLASVLADLRREDCVERLSIRGLDRDGVAAFVAAARGAELDDIGRGLAARLSGQTEGNPFFVAQILRHLAESGAFRRVDGRWVPVGDGDGFEIPEGVREVVGRRVSRLSAAAGELLQVAAVAGLEFETAIVAAVAARPADAALDGFDEAVQSRLLLETEVPGRLRFVHALVRQTLNEELTTLRRVSLHRDIALAIEARHGDDDHAVADLAHHFAEAAAGGEGERAATYTERAALQAMDRGATEQAIQLMERALELLPPDADPDGLRRDRLYQYLCQLSWVVADPARGADPSRRWLALGEALGDDAMRAVAAGWLAVSFIWRAAPGPDDLAALVSALHVDPVTLDLHGRQCLMLKRSWASLDVPAVSSTLLAFFGAAWALGVPLDAIADELPAADPLALGDLACRVAQRSAHPQWEEQSRFLRGYALIVAPDAHALLATSEEAVDQGYTYGGGGWMLKSFALARLGRLDDLRAWADEMLVVAERSGDRVVGASGHRARAVEALARGRLDDGQRATDKILDVLPAESPIIFAHTELTIGRLLASGDTDQARRIVDTLDASSPLDTKHLLGAVAVAQGDLDTARAVLDSWHAANRRVRLDFSRTAQLWGLAQCARALQDRDAAAVLYDSLRPYDGQFLLVSLDFISASAAHVLGQLTETFNQPDRAAKHYTDALAFEQKCGAHSLTSQTREALARLA
jgi:class 3 adenylate cyclase/tetratricopeptide (TPR) repeat protein